MLNVRKLLWGLLASASLFVSGIAAVHAIPVTQLGFALDSSGSVSSSNYTLQTQGLAQALSALPTDSTVEVSVIDFGSSVTTHINAVVIDSVATRDSVVATVAAMAKGGGTTNMSGAIGTLTNLLTSSGNFADPDSRAIINLSTDGAPNNTTNTTSAASSALSAGIDALTAEGVGSSNDAFLQSIVFNPQGGLGTGVILPEDSSPPNPLTADNAWVVPVSDFNAYATVISSKVEAIVPPTNGTVPVPSSIALMAIGLLTLGLRFRHRTA